jgi:putative sigma-54 modulation protein
MQTPLQLTFRSMAHSDALAAHFQRRSAKLDHLTERIVSCRIVVELAGHHRSSGDRFHVSIHVGLPGHEVIVSYAPAEHEGPETAHVSADRAFDEAERQIEDWVRRRRSSRRPPPGPDLGE